MSTTSGVFSDFCQAWVARFPGSELPAAWEEDVRANLKKHKTKVAILREELEKEEMYVEYLNKLLVDIEQHRKKSTSSSSGPEPISDEPEEDSTVESMNEENKRRSNPVVDVDDFLELDPRDESLEVDTNGNEKLTGDKAELHLDIEKAKELVEDANEPSTFVTVINVSSPSQKDQGNTRNGGPQEAGKEKAVSRDSAKKTSKDVSTPPQPAKRMSTRRKQVENRESLKSVSSPTTPTSPVISSSTEDLGVSREGLADDPLNSSISSSSEEEENSKLREKTSPISLSSNGSDIRRSQPVAKRALVAGNTGTFEKRRGQPDGRDMEDDAVRGQGTVVGEPSAAASEDPPFSKPPALGPRPNKIKELMANWENKTPVAAKAAEGPRLKSSHPESSRPRRNDSDNSSRGRMGSPSGKSHDSSDSETHNSSWSNRANKTSTDNSVSPGARRKLPGETRLDRLVRRPSGEKGPHTVPPTSGIPVPCSKKPRPKPRGSSKDQIIETCFQSTEEPLYDTVANDEGDDDYYDNHLIYTPSSRTNKSDTMRSGGGSSADLGFDEPPCLQHVQLPTLKSAQSGLSLTGSGTLSSSDTDGLSASPSFRRGISLEEEQSNYVNIQYFIHQSHNSSLGRQLAAQSDDELDFDEGSPSLSTPKHGMSPPVRNQVRDSTADHQTPPPLPQPNSNEAERILMYKCILNSIVESEAIYLEGLSVMLQYMKAMKVTLSTPNPVIPREDFEAIFYKVPELHDLHYTFHDNLKRQVDRWNGSTDCTIGHTFKMLASRTKTYASFLNNYQKALEALHRCTQCYPQFADLTRSIKLRTVKGQRQGQSLSLEDLLHKPVARVQKNCLCLQDLIKYTLVSHPDYQSLSEALSTIQTFVNEYNVVHTSDLFPSQERQQRHLVKNSFIVELSDGQRKLRHLFLFNDVLVCAKYKQGNSGKNEKFTFQLKWFIPLNQVISIHFL